MRGLLASQPNIAVMISDVKVFHRHATFFGTECPKTQRPCASRGRCVMFTQRPHALHRTSCENTIVFVGATERSGGWPPPCRGAILSLPPALMPRISCENMTFSRRGQTPFFSFQGWRKGWADAPIRTLLMCVRMPNAPHGAETRNRVRYEDVKTFSQGLTA